LPLVLSYDLIPFISGDRQDAHLAILALIPCWRPARAIVSSRVRMSNGKPALLTTQPISHPVQRFGSFRPMAHDFPSPPIMMAFFRRNFSLTFARGAVRRMFVPVSLSGAARRKTPRGEDRNLPNSAQYHPARTISVTRYFTLIRNSVTLRSIRWSR